MLKYLIIEFNVGKYFNNDVNRQVEQIFNL